MAIEDLRVIGNVLYERRSDGLLYPVRQVAGQTPAQSQPQAPQGLLSGIPELGRMVNTLGTFNQMFNPVEGIGQSMDASRRMVAPDTSTMDRLAALGDMLSGVAGVTAPIGAAVRAGTPAAVALMEGLLGGSPTVTAARDTARAAGRGFVERMNQPGPVPTMGSNFANLLGDVGEASTGIRAYQGSPHDFAAERLVRMPDGSTQYMVGAPDVLPNVPAGAEVLQDFPMGRVRMDKINTGEGAQGYGYGAYAAENETIGRTYRDKVSAMQGKSATVEGRNINWDNPYETAAFEVMRHGGDREAAAKFYENTFRNSDVPSIIRSGVALPEVKSPGRMYELNINADPNAMLDWDNPLGQQSDAVRAAFSSLGTPERLASVKGENAYRALQDQSGAMDWPVGASLAERNAVRQTASENVRQKLLEAGIPGIKYLDQGSRGAGAGSRNYVVFDENLISIVRKYGIAGAAAMLGVSAVDVKEAMARGQPQQGLLSMGSK